jgi:hypothetical protein
VLVLVGVGVATLTTNPSMPPPGLVWKASLVVGRSAEVVDPTMYARPVASTSMSRATSLPLDPRYEPYAREVAAPFSLATNESCPPPRVVWKASAVSGKSLDIVEPTRYAFSDPSTSMASGDSVPLPPR